MKFRKKPIVVEAEQWLGPESLGKIKGVRVASSIPVSRSIAGDPPYYLIDTLEGTMRVHPGDWIITGVKGEKYACRDDIFEATYEKVDDWDDTPLPEDSAIDAAFPTRSERHDLHGEAMLSRRCSNE